MTGKVVSDGGSSGYYQLTIVNRKTGESFNCEMGDVIASVYDNDFDMGNIAKAMRRIAQDRIGRGKAGNNAKYDAKKCVYFSEILVQVAEMAERAKALTPNVGLTHLIQMGAPSHPLGVGVK